MPHANPLFLSSLQLCQLANTRKVTKRYPAASQFCNRHDFIITPGMSGMVAEMIFTNAESLISITAKGIRHLVSIVLTDTTDKRILHTVAMRVSIPRRTTTRTYRTALPMPGGEIKPAHSYTVCVYDNADKKLLGSAQFNLFGEYMNGSHLPSYYVPDCGGIALTNTDAICKSLHAIDMDYYWIRLQLKTSASVVLWKQPELLMRIYFPDGTTETGVCCPEFDEEDGDEDLYQVGMPFLVTAGNKGIGYVEFSCLEHVICGYAFNTKHLTINSVWTGKGLRALRKYSLNRASLRFSAYRDELLFYENLENCEEEDTGISGSLRTFSFDEDLPDTPKANAGDNASDNSTTGNSAAASLADLTGLQKVKDKLAAYEKVVRFNKMRIDNGLPATTTPLHAMFMGSPGTGKTTVAKIIGYMLAQAGVLSKGHVVVKERANLIGPHYSNEESNTLEAIEEAKGGILLIDEAYQLYQPNDPRDPGRFAIETLMTALADESRRDWMLILAGYPDEMKRMFDLNPGLKSRIPESNIYTFDDFCATELMEIAERFFERNGYTLTDEARDALQRRLKCDLAHKDKNFGNARHVINMIQTDILPAMAVRVTSIAKPDKNALSEIMACDIPQRPAIYAQQTRPRIGYRL